MLSGFEKQTEELTENEKTELLPVIIRGLNTKKGQKNAVTNKQIVKGLAQTGKTITEVRVRKIINHIRVNDLIPMLIATSKGYYIATEKDEILEYITSLRGRENAIRRVREKIEQQYNIQFN